MYARTHIMSESCFVNLSRHTVEWVMSQTLKHNQHETSPHTHTHTHTHTNTHTYAHTHTHTCTRMHSHTHIHTHTHTLTPSHTHNAINMERLYSRILLRRDNESASTYETEIHRTSPRYCQRQHHDAQSNGLWHTHGNTINMKTQST